MRFVELKSVEQLDIQTLHRARSRLVSERTNQINQLRAILLERGVIFPVGRRKLEQGVNGLLAETNEALSPRMSRLIAEMCAEWNSMQRLQRRCGLDSQDKNITLSAVADLLDIPALTCRPQMRTFVKVMQDGLNGRKQDPPLWP